MAVDYEWNREIPILKPLPGKDNGKLVLFDVSHMSTTGQSDWVINGGFSDFAGALVAEGFTVEEYRGVDKNDDGLYTFFDDRFAENIEKNEWIITFDAIKRETARIAMDKLIKNGKFSPEGIKKGSAATFKAEYIFYSISSKVKI